MNPEEIKKLADDLEDFNKKLEEQARFLQQGYEAQRRIEIDNFRAEIIESTSATFDTMGNYIRELQSAGVEAQTVGFLISNFNQLARKMKKLTQVNFIKSIDN